MAEPSGVPSQVEILKLRFSTNPQPNTHCPRPSMVKRPYHGLPLQILHCKSHPSWLSPLTSHPHSISTNPQPNTHCPHPSMVKRPYHGLPLQVLQCRSHPPWQSPLMSQPPLASHHGIAPSMRPALPLIGDTYMGAQQQRRAVQKAVVP